MNKILLFCVFLYNSYSFCLVNIDAISSDALPVFFFSLILHCEYLLLTLYSDLFVSFNIL